MTHEEVAELLGAYALDAVGEDEAALVEAHVAECPRCTAELAEHYEVAGMLGNMGGDASKDLWERIASQATRPPGADTLATPSILAAPARRHRQRRRGPVLVAACAVLAVAVIALLAVQIGRLDTKVNDLTALTTVNAIKQAEMSALLDPSTQRVVLASSTPGAPAAAEVILAASGRSFLVNRTLAPLSRAQTYQLWSVTGTGGRAVSLGLLGNTPSIVPFQVGAAAPGTVFAVTVERAAGVVVSKHAPVAEGVTAA